MGVTFQSQYTCPTFEKALADYAAAMKKYEEGVNGYAQRIRSSDGAERAFLATKEGQKVDVELRDASRRKKAVGFVMGKNLALNTFPLRELQGWGLEALCQVAAEHGMDESTWPYEVTAKLHKQLEQARIVHYSEARAARAARHRGESEMACRAALAKHGDDPNKWPDTALDEIARLEQREQAFERLVRTAMSSDGNWERRFSDTAPSAPKVPDEPKASKGKAA